MHLNTHKNMAKNTLYGTHSVIEAINAGTQIEKIYLQKDTQNERLKELKSLASTHNVPFQMVPMEKIRSLCPTGNHQGVVALMAEIFYQSLEELLISLQAENKVPLLVMLDGVTDVRNVGAIARSAECMGAHALILPTSGSAAINADAIKVSAGALSHLPVCRESHLLDVAYMLQSYKIPLFACTEKSKDTIFEMDFTTPVCLVFGAEDKGISTGILKICEKRAKIPMLGKVESLNVSVSVGMVLCEAVRQRLASAAM